MNNEAQTQKHLADLIEEELSSRGWTLFDMVARMGPILNDGELQIRLLSWEFFLSLRDSDVLLSKIEARELGEAFNVDPVFFEKFHEAWREGCGKERQKSTNAS